MFGRSTACSCRKNVYVEYHHFMTKKLQQNIFKSVENYAFCRDTDPEKLAFINLDCIIAGLHYMLSKTTISYKIF